jgi:hypothetical protein
MRTTVLAIELKLRDGVAFSKDDRQGISDDLEHDSVRHDIGDTVIYDRSKSLIHVQCD